MMEKMFEDLLQEIVEKELQNQGSRANLGTLVTLHQALPSTWRRSGTQRLGGAPHRSGGGGPDSAE